MVNDKIFNESNFNTINCGIVINHTIFNVKYDMSETIMILYVSITEVDFLSIPRYIHIRCIDISNLFDTNLDFQIIYFPISYFNDNNIDTFSPRYSSLVCSKQSAVPIFLNIYIICRLKATCSADHQQSFTKKEKERERKRASG